VLFGTLVDISNQRRRSPPRHTGVVWRLRNGASIVQLHAEAPVTRVGRFASWWYGLHSGDRIAFVDIGGRARQIEVYARMIRR
jgi:hypothetical protein